MQLLSVWAYGWHSMYVCYFLTVIQTSKFGKYLVNRRFLLSVKVKKVKEDCPPAPLPNDPVVESRETQPKIHMERCRMKELRVNQG